MSLNGTEQNHSGLRQSPGPKGKKVEVQGLETARSTDRAHAAQPGEPGQDRVLSEVSHALGNIIHRMYYWAELLQEPRERQEADAMGELKNSLSSLHQLVSRTMELVRTLEPRRMTVKADELLLSLSRRLNCEIKTAEDEANDGWHSSELELDPQHLARGVELVTELSASAGGFRPEGAKIQATTGNCEDGATLRFELVFPRAGRGLAVRCDSCEGELGWALASRYLAHAGGRLEVSQDAESLVVTMVFPRSEEAEGRPPGDAGV
ncbi:MAG: hypothetical protein ACE5E4_12010 [Candidatus Binatia bacterium]